MENLRLGSRVAGYATVVPLVCRGVGVALRDDTVAMRAGAARAQVKNKGGAQRENTSS